MADSLDSRDETPPDKREISRRELFQKLVPAGTLASWGRPAIDASKCSACGLCAGACENKSLVAAGDDCLVLTFRKDLCDACNRCFDVCPEKALSRAPAGENDDPSAVLVLFQDEPAHCVKCNAVIGSKAMIRRISSRLKASDPAVAARIQLCGACRESSN